MTKREKEARKKKRKKEAEELAKGFLGCFIIIIVIALAKIFFDLFIDFLAKLKSLIVDNKWIIALVVFIIAFIFILRFTLRYILERKSTKKYDGSPFNPDIYADAHTNGIEFEKYAAIKLSHLGYRKIKFTDITGDHGADLIAIAPDRVKCAIQCKCYSRPVGNKAIQEALTGSAYYDCERAIVVTNNTFTKQAIEDANKVGVILYEYF